MPRYADELDQALKKKGGLTLSQLANYDDILTDSLVDRVYYWSTIRKLKSTYHSCRGITESEVTKILQDHVILNKDPVAAHKRMLHLSGIRRFYEGLASRENDDQQEHFERHLRKYINIWLPDCPFEVSTTVRYTITTPEAKVVARKPIRRGEPIKYLSGIQVEMTEKEEKELTGRTDFSIVLSSRRKRPSLFLGPARFANHDCDSNGRLNTTGPHGIHIVARKDIETGDEITVTYGEDYFGIDNCECLCATCERLMRNGWDPRGPVLHQESSDDESDSEDERSTSRKQTSRAPAISRKRKRDDGYESDLGYDEARPIKRKVGRPRKHPRKNDYDDLFSSRRGRLSHVNKHDTQSSESSSAYSNTFDEPAQTPPSSSTSVDGSAPTRKAEQSFERRNISQGIIDLYTNTPQSRESPPQPVESIENSNQTEKKTSAGKGKGTGSGEEEVEVRGPIRTPGDYHLCRALLSTAYHRWVQCRNCDEDFVQSDAYLTRIACPRCERHSKLYGYHWPKTDRENKYDTEERVLDHRTIHRFIEPDEERIERKGRKTLAEVIRERELSSRQESEESEGLDKGGGGYGSGRERRLRNSPRKDREVRRKLRMTM
ncbi:hypothetical protein K431DRAFT_224071 [Polychaeton citri CBS 116435]|uniref:Histone-lysine N-methyltransferase SET9 n=1 Tax=Polychaeton citri CBS 116435 TaxID=1314669 RepID=A0A9P4Q8F6_9PEZI|nr:hypothetical protein K431DRAFT_224071 [Polychaeton citri CBS 116435]